MRLRRVLAVVAVGIGLAAGPATWLVLAPTRTLAEGALLIEVPAHVGVREIARQLEEQQVVRSSGGFVALSFLRGSARRLKAGEYEVPRGASTLDVLALLESGRVKQHAVLHREGDTIAELARTLEKERLAAAADVLRVARDPAFLASLGIEAATAEGYLFPDTYQFVRGMAVEEILRRMIQRLRSRITTDHVARAKARGLTLHQLLTLASIIERESVAPDELRLISAVFWNRLALDMPLQADPTVQYATGKGRQTLTRTDLNTDHPYNTYRRSGLPPGPIASAGLPAIEAVLDPAPVKYLYFVAIDERRHQFSRTVDEHNLAVARYRQFRNR